jgi:predicted enzyme related to lactoylglutathione lyase
VGWIDLTVEDATESCDFWAAVGGFDAVEAVPMGGWSDFVLSEDGRAVAGLRHRRGKNANVPTGIWLIHLVVDDLAAALDEATRRGGTILERGPTEAIVKDTSGAIAALWEHHR